MRRFCGQIQGGSAAQKSWQKVGNSLKIRQKNASYIFAIKKALGRFMWQ